VSAWTLSRHGRVFGQGDKNKNVRADHKTTSSTSNGGRRASSCVIILVVASARRSEIAISRTVACPVKNPVCSVPGASRLIGESGLRPKPAPSIGRSREDRP